MRKNIFNTRNLSLVIVVVLTFSLTACGTSTATSPSEESIDYVAPEQEQLADSDTEDYAGEGEVQGGMLTDEELAEREQEASSTDSWDGEEDPDYPDANVEMTETPTSSDTFISSDNFWNGDDFFDLEEYYWMNGARNVQYESGENYPPFAIFNGWIIYTAGSGCNVYNIQDWNQNERPFKAYNIHDEFLFDSPPARINDSGANIMKNLPALLDEVIPCLLENSDKDDPFEDTELDHVHLY